MRSTAILHEIQQLYNASDHLDLLAEEHPLFAEALITNFGKRRNNATLLEVLVTMKMGPIPGLDSADA